MRKLLTGMMLMLSALPASAQAPESQWKSCTTSAAPTEDQRISDCTQLIQGGTLTKPNLAIAYHGRAIGYERKVFMTRRSPTRTWRSRSIRTTPWDTTAAPGSIT